MSDNHRPFMERDPETSAGREAISFLMALLAGFVNAHTKEPDHREGHESGGCGPSYKTRMAQARRAIKTWAQRCTHP